MEENITRDFIPIQEKTNISEKLKFHNSANFLCNFTTKVEYMHEIIKNMAIKPRYFEEDVRYLGIQQIQKISFPMTCFCDIPLTKVKHHTKVYGEYGIALKKNSCIIRDVQPITYINKNSRLKKDLSDVFSQLFSLEMIPEEYSFFSDFLLGQLLFTKPIEGYMRRGDEDPEWHLFKDESEWRYIPIVPASLPTILGPSDNTHRGRQVYSEALGRHKETWFSFTIEDIEYIIVPTEIDAVGMISSIKHMKKPLREKELLISKIEVLDKISDNF